MTRKFKIYDLVILIAVASTTFYIIFRNLPRVLGSFALLWGPLALLTVLIMRPKSFTREPMNILILYGIIIVGILQYTLWKYMMDFNRIRILYEYFYLFVFTAIWSYYNLKRDILGLAFLSKWAFIFIIISLITTNIALFIDPAIVRASANNADFTSLQNNIYNILGTMDYSYVQAIIGLIPILVFYIKSERKFLFPRKILIIILLLIIITELRSLVFANIMVTILITILSFISSKNRRITFITITISGLIFIAIPNSFYAKLFSDLGSNFDPNTVTYKKLTGISVFIENPEVDNTTDIGRRVARYPLLFEALAARPVLGHSSYNSRQNIGAGAHLYWMNRLAIWGIPGFLFFIFVLFKVFRNIGSQFEPGYRYYYFLSVMAVILLGLTKAVGGREPWLMLIVVIPGLYYLPLLKQSKRRASNGMKGKLSVNIKNKPGSTVAEGL